MADYDDVKKLYRPTFDEFRNYVNDLWERVNERDFVPDMIIEVKRGGATVARVLSDISKIKNIQSVRCENYSSVGVRLKEPRVIDGIGPEKVYGKNVLIVDDTADSGRTVKKLREYFSGLEPNNMVYATLYAKDRALENEETSPDVWVKKQKPNQWIIFPGEEEETIISYLREWKRNELYSFEDELCSFEDIRIEKQLFTDNDIERAIANEWYALENDEQRLMTYQLLEADEMLEDLKN